MDLATVHRWGYAFGIAARRAATSGSRLVRRRCDPLLPGDGGSGEMIATGGVLGGFTPYVVSENRFSEGINY